MLINPVFLAGLDVAALDRALGLSVTRIPSAGERQYQVDGGEEPHAVDLSDLTLPGCDCGDHTWRESVCKHITAALLHEGDPQVRLAARRAWNAARRTEACPVPLPALGFIAPTWKDSLPGRRRPAVTPSAAEMFLGRCTTGDRLRAYFREMATEIIWAVPEHPVEVASAVLEHRPAVILAFGPDVVAKIAEGLPCVQRDVAGAHFIYGPHPATWADDTHDELHRMARELRSFLSPGGAAW